MSFLAILLEIMAIWAVAFQAGDTKLERFLPKNQHTQRLMSIKNANNKRRCPKSEFFNGKKMRKIRMIFDIEN